MPSRSFQHSAVANAPSPMVWEALNDSRSWESISGVDRILDSVVDEEGQLRGFTFESVAAGKKYVGRASPAGREPERMLAWDIETSEIRGRIIVSLAEAGEGTRVDVTLRMESVGVLSSVFFPVITAAIENGFPRSVDEFAAHLSQA